MNSTNEVFKKIENKIIERLEQGEIPWDKPFEINDTPINAKTGNYYSGINEWLLQLLSSGDPYFIGFKQAQYLGGHIKKGESGLPIMFPMIKYWDKETGEEIKAGKAQKMRDEEYNKSVNYSYSYVWHIDQTEGINRENLPSLSDKDELVFEPISQCENLLARWNDCPDIRREGTSAYYHLKDDYINIPRSQYFTSEAEVYATIFHEAIHATGNGNRLNREKPKQFADKKYSFEELIAEFGSAYLCGYAGIEKQTIENKSAYIKNWHQALTELSDGDWIVKACRKAREAADYIIAGGLKPKRESKGP